MSRWLRLSSTAVVAFLSLALVFSVLPRTWIESTFGVDPDGGSGVLELALIFVPIAIAVAASLFRKPARDLRATDSHSIVSR